MRLSFGRSRINSPYAISDGPGWEAVAQFLGGDAESSGAVSNWLEFAAEASRGEVENEMSGNATALSVGPTSVRISSLYSHEPETTSMSLREFEALLATWRSFLTSGRPTFWRSPQTGVGDGRAGAS
jgi:hypothetical protein